ncbi:MAG: hypothetical protein WC498_01145 [Candidatus Saccharimonadales bacterium]
MKLRTGIVLASCLSVLVLAVAPVWAEHGQAETTTTTTNTGSTTTNTGSTTSTDTSKKDSTSKDNETAVEVENHVKDLREQGASLLTKEREAKHTEHTHAEREKACEDRQGAIDTRTGNFGVAAQRHLDVFNGIFTKVQSFATTNKLTAPNYDSLVATAQAKQTAAQQAVDALKALNVKIDCTAPDPASAVATVKTAVANARTALHDYRVAIKNIIVALQSANSTENSTTTGGNQ